jgi:hypothetical protein
MSAETKIATKVRRLRDVRVEAEFYYAPALLSTGPRTDRFRDSEPAKQLRRSLAALRHELPGHVIDHHEQLVYKALDEALRDG